MRNSLFWMTASCSLLAAANSRAADVTVDPTQGQSRISPYVYGANQVDGSNVKFTAWRQGGNRLTAYNWENNFSNAGSDWENSSDTFLCDNRAACSAPGATITQFVDTARTAGAYPLVTLQMAGYVSADSNGTVTAAQAAPSSRWKQVVARKGSAFSTSPDTTDDKVYMDELVNFLVQRYGKASAGGVPGYSLDNEPDLWSYTHSLVHADPCGAAELVQRSAELASAVKAVDSSAEIFGFVSYGYNGFISLQDAPDWASVQGNYEWYVQYFLAQMAAASSQAGTRLLDVLDLHYYSEAQGNGTRVQEGTTTNAAARVQSTRSLWDPNYGYSANDPTAGENSWITQWNDPIQLIPRVKGYIRSLYPDTKLAITEYDFGAADHVSGGSAQADALGIYGRDGVYVATRWGEPGTYTDAAYRLYLDYDGQGSRFGNISVKAASSDIVNVPVYAAVNEANPNVLHVILINRNLSAAQTATVSIGGTSSYGAGQAWGFDGTSATLSSKGAVTVSGNAFSLSLPALSATHVVLTTGDPPPITGVGGASGTGGATGAPGGGSNATSGGFGVGVGGNTSTSSDAPDAGGEAAKNDTGGCGCRLATRSASADSVIAVLALLLLRARRRR